jgi:hypothetical protein
VAYRNTYGTAAVSRESGIEGVEGNVHASRAWKGNGEWLETIVVPRLHSFSSHIETEQVFRHLLLPEAEWPVSLG